MNGYNPFQLTNEWSKCLYLDQIVAEWQPQSGNRTSQALNLRKEPASVSLRIEEVKDEDKPNASDS
jgi:hypothetical protein